VLDALNTRLENRPFVITRGKKCLQLIDMRLVARPEAVTWEAEPSGDAVALTFIPG